MGSRFNKIRSRRCPLDSALDWAEIEALIREAIALLVESGELPDPTHARPRSRPRAGARKRLTNYMVDEDARLESWYAPPVVMPLIASAGLQPRPQEGAP